MAFRALLLCRIGIPLLYKVRLHTPFTECVLINLVEEVDMRSIVRIMAAAACLAMVPAAAYAQVALAGTVKDASGAVLPGVTVEAASPVLIEKTRTAVSDATGQYRIESLTPGTYTVTFTLSGFSTLKREGVELSGNGVITINADLKVGGVAETI